MSMRVATSVAVRARSGKATFTSPPTGPSGKPELRVAARQGARLLWQYAKRRPAEAPDKIELPLGDSVKAVAKHTSGQTLSLCLFVRNGSDWMQVMDFGDRGSQRYSLARIRGGWRQNIEDLLTRYAEQYAT